MLALYVLLFVIGANVMGGLCVYIYRTSTAQKRFYDHAAKLFPVPAYKPDPMTINNDNHL